MRILISAGPTRERIDPVRFISNRSTGKMGYALAEKAKELGHDVVLISGPVSLTPVDGVKTVYVESAKDMAMEMKKYAEESEVIISCAAVADYTPKVVADEKIKKGGDSLTIELIRTEDILATLGENKQAGQLLVGFAAETFDLINNANKKLLKKNLDWIIANDVKRDDIGFGSNENAVTMISKTGEQIAIEKSTKKEIAFKILTNILK